MKRRPISPAADTLRLTKPNTTGVHLIYGPPPALRTNGLQPIGKTTSAQVREAQRRMDEALSLPSLCSSSSGPRIGNAHPTFHEPPRRATHHRFADNPFAVFFPGFRADAQCSRRMAKAHASVWVSFRQSVGDCSGNGYGGCNSHSASTRHGVM